MLKQNKIPVAYLMGGGYQVSVGCILRSPHTEGVLKNLVNDTSQFKYVFS